jgi:hypothetical protein
MNSRIIISTSVVGSSVNLKFFFQNQVFCNLVKISILKNAQNSISLLHLSSKNYKIIFIEGFPMISSVNMMTLMIELNYEN